MKRFIKSLTLVALFASYCIPSLAQAPSTEGKDFWVTFLRAGDANSGASGHGDPQELKLTISAREACIVTIQQEGVDDIVLSVGDNSSTEIGSNTTTAKDINGRDRKLTLNSCYSYDNEAKTKTAAHVTATKDISLFAGNYRDKSFDAANILPTPALLDDYLVQTYPPSDHEDKPHGSHFAIVAVEDGATTVDFNLTAKTNKGNIGAQNVTLKKGEVYYIWTGKNAGDEADLSGTTIKARNGKKIAVFQGCVHTNIPDHVRDRDHIFSQAMPTAYWGTEFGITASRKHRRDIVAVMAINDGTEVYINSDDGEPVKVHTFDFTKDKKQYWTFEIGENLAYCADMSDSKPGSPFTGKLPAPLIVDSSCYLTTSCPAGVHLFMVSNRYDNIVPKVKDDTLVSDPAMLWISPIEQVIKEINFSTYSTNQDSLHFMNIVTTTGNVPSMKWNGQSIANHFHPLRGTDNQYSFARILIQNGHVDKNKRVNHNLKGDQGFLAHVYGYGQRESYAYSCGSSTVQRSISFNDLPLEIDSVSKTTFCVNEEIEMRLNIGNNDYQSVHWDYGDGVTYDSDPNESSAEMRVSRHTYTAPGWFDLEVLAKYINPCTGKEYSDTLGLRFRVNRPDTIRHTGSDCVDPDYTGKMTILDTVPYGCDSIVIIQKFLHYNSAYDTTVYAEDYYQLEDSVYTTSTVVNDTILNRQLCDSVITWHINIVKCLGMQFENKPEEQEICAGDGNLDIPFSYNRDGDHLNAYLCLVKHDPTAEWGYRLIDTTLIDVVEKGEEGDRKLALVNLPISEWAPGRYVGCILMEDANCKIIKDGVEVPSVEQSTALDITVKYPEDIMVFRFNNVLAVYQKGFGGNKGYDFVAYQWYLNGEEIDKQKNPSAATSIFHSPEIFTTGDEYYVMLTEKGKEPVPSCSFFVPSAEELDDYTPKQDGETANNAPQASKKVINSRICVEFEGRTYDMYGQRVK